MTTQYAPPKKWQAPKDLGGKFAGINKPTAGARFENKLQVGKHLLQLYSLATPNGQKVTIMLEELLALGLKEAEYDAYLINIGEGEQFGDGFVAINPNSKIPALVDLSGEAPINVFESGNILLYLAEKFGRFLASTPLERATTLNWLFWLQGAAPFLGGGFGHFYVYAPKKYEYPINRFSMEVKRQLDLLDKQLKDNRFIAGDKYSIADMAIWPWHGNLALGKLYEAKEFLGLDEYPNLQRWAQEIADRPAVGRGIIVNKSWGEPWEQLSERHRSEDIDAVLALKSVEGKK